ncbi:MAG: hypothetical protein FWF70_05700 [Bacteroidetes bacterium]|nr:hypothetical protein [Bacteroidota bacterium]MCL1968357.1 hypothetical protein [Bacteroidota bacterium]
MSSRSERVINQLETFTYDNLDRLTGFTNGHIGQQGTLQTFVYSNNGNINSSSNLGNYIYDNKPHAVTRIIAPKENPISPNNCAVTYNFFNQPTKIEEGKYRIELSYGADQQRKKMKTYRNDTLEYAHTYYNKYFEHEFDYTLDTAIVSRSYYYIYGDNGVVAMHITTRSGKDTTEWGTDTAIVIKSFISTDSTYYIHTDHLGNYAAITNAAKKVRQQNWFDPWGNYQIRYDTIRGRGIDPPPHTLIENYFLNFPLTLRGFTGHEHYPQFKIINMNGRLYDPVIARFFSPDKYVMNSSFTQDFNRYSYARNNPLMYTDPDGEFIQFVIGAVVGFINGLSQGADIAKAAGKTEWAKFGIMMAAAHISAGIGAATAGLGCALNFGGVAAGAITGAALDHTTSILQPNTNKDLTITFGAGDIVENCIKTAQLYFYSNDFNKEKTIIDVTANFTTGIEELTMNNEQLTIYPNPTSGEFKIQNLKFKVLRYLMFTADFKVTRHSSRNRIRYFTSTDRNIFCKDNNGKRCGDEESGEAMSGVR